MCDALYALHTNAQEQGDYAGARPFLERGVALVRTVAASARGVDAVTSWRLGMGLVGLGMLAALEGDARAALDHVQESSEYLKRIGQSALPAISYFDMGLIARDSGDFEQARALIQDSLETFEQLEDRRGVALALAHLGDLATARGDFQNARTLLGRSLQLNREVGELTGTAFVLVRFAEIAAAQAQPRRALRLAGAAASLRARVEVELPFATQHRLDSQLEQARRALGPDATVVYEQGRALSFEAAIAEALAVGTPERSESNTARPDLLTPRECDVAMLIARGYSNRQVAEELVIGEATVATHVQHILQKLQLASRTQVAIWAERQHTSGGNQHAVISG
jgi:DNA-binding NarL/FixJ family response regulator